MNTIYRTAALLAFALVTTLSYAQEKLKGSKPNIIVILCDDLGRGDLGVTGHPIIKTPNLDAMAKNGILFTDCYASSPVCSPSRAGLLTGRTPNRTGIYDWIANSSYLKTSEVTIAEQMKQAGYNTGLFGKWHLNSKFNTNKEPTPADHGFDYWFATKNNASPSHENPNNFVRNGKSVGKLEGFSAYLVAEEFNNWVATQAKSTPFFSYITFHEPHLPIASDPELVAQYTDKAKIAGQDQYYANVSQVDKAVGKILKQLKKQGLDKNTLIFFTSDNGPETWMRYKAAWLSHGTPGEINGTKLRGMKLHITEGGIRVPGIAYWPGKIAKSQIVNEPVSAVDLLPTLSELAGVNLPDVKLDGTSILALFENKTIQREQSLFWFYFNAKGSPGIALRKGDFMLLARRNGEFYRSGTPFSNARMPAIKESKPVRYEFYNLKDDVGQTTYVDKKYPVIYEAMKAEMNLIFDNVQEESPIWEN